MIGTTCDVISSALRLWRSVCLYIHPAWVVCHLSLLTGSEGLGRGVSGQQPALFFMSSLGNRDLLGRHLVAFFASRSVTPEAESRCIAWAESMCNTDSVVISGFHSPLEKRILKVLLEHKHPVILLLGRAMYKRVPAEFQDAINEGRMLIDSVRDFERHSWSSAQTRNWYAASIADEVFLTPFDENSMLSPMYYSLTHYSNTPVKIL